jgi:hypothetical protein
VLEQVPASAQLTRVRPLIDAALRSSPGVTGFSLRVPWTTLDTDWAVLNLAKQIAETAGKALTVRFMAGRYTPGRVFGAGAYSYTSSHGYKMPCPFNPATGKGGNPVYEKYFRETVTRLATWCRVNGVRTMHLPWYGFLWAEIYNGDELEKVKNYTFEAWLAGHRKVAQIAQDIGGPDLAVEFPLSGHWGTTKGAAGEVGRMLTSVFGEDCPYLVVQGNGMGSYNQACTSQPIRHGKQMYDAADYDWAELYDLLRRKNEEYLEVYTQSFGLANKGLLAAEAATFRFA